MLPKTTLLTPSIKKIITKLQTGNILHGFKQ